MRILLLFALLFALFGIGCDDDRDTQCYEGKVISLNQGSGCFNLIEILKPNKNTGLPVNSRVSFDPDKYNGTLEIGDTVYFMVNGYEIWDGYYFTNCSPPNYTCQIEFCDL